VSNYEFIMKEDVGKFVGQWLAVSGANIVAHGKNLKRVVKKAKDIHPHKVPLVMKVPEKGTLIL